ncbi:hypothetical protein [Klenkia taihuensis]|uniref:ANTAR domain-containing protein n=1 Tax=Klenkia taihuensis TaxID=1225127 RepID=A0A1I1G9J1_9ACTN|nr:hypothetical protein [Klenkia taihuensis]GHE09882.1 GAF domain-containing protein [Klenkia taihuensis]SFC08245.1 hypothetical protein SAMN05661030_0055 [Klenkia taihuensis]
MSLVERFRHELARTPDGDLLPDRLARVCTALLPVDGAGLSAALLPDHRLPLGASDPVAAAAERLQFTLGEGPCLTAQQTRTRVVAATVEELRDRWPVYTLQLTGLTPFCSVLSTPVGGSLSGVVALDLYRSASGPLAEDVLAAVADVADAVGEALAGDLAEDGDLQLGLPPLLRTPAIDARQRVWLAIGQLAGVQGSTTSAALATLRALAFRHGIDIDAAADRVLTGEITLPAP